MITIVLQSWQEGLKKVDLSLLQVSLLYLPLREAKANVDALLDNGRRGRAITGSNKRPLKSLADGYFIALSAAPCMPFPEIPAVEARGFVLGKVALMLSTAFIRGSAVVPSNAV